MSDGINLRTAYGPVTINRHNWTMIKPANGGSSTLLYLIGSTNPEQLEIPYEEAARILTAGTSLRLVTDERK